MFLASDSEIQLPNLLSVLFKASPNSQHIRVFISTCWEFIRTHGKTLSHTNSCVKHFTIILPSWQSGSAGTTNFFTCLQKHGGKHQQPKALNKHLSKLLLSTLIIRHVVGRNSQVSAYLHLAESKAREATACPPRSQVQGAEGSTCQ